MVNYAKRLGDFLSGFTGEHVGEPRVLICLYDNPLLHVDIKFLTLDEFHHRVETPILLLDRSKQLDRLFATHRRPFRIRTTNGLKTGFGRGHIMRC